MTAPEWLTQPLSDKITLVVLIGIAVALGGVVVFTQVGPGAGKLQRRNMNAAEFHIQSLEEAILKERRFSDVRFYVYTGQGGAIGVGGIVDDDADALALRELIESTEPAVPVNYGSLRITARIEQELVDESVSETSRE